MERLDTWIKGLGTFLGVVASVAVGGLKYAFPALLALMLADFITGMMASSYEGTGLKSDVGRRGFIRKLYIIILIGSVYIIELVISHMAQSYFSFDIPLGHLGNGVSVAYAVLEFLSIAENGGRMGVPLPGRLKKMIAVLKHQVEDEGGQK